MTFSIQRITRIAILSALTIVVTLTTTFHFGGTIAHLGAVIVITTVLLFGPLDGSIVAIIGMGLYDLFFYNPASAPKTIISYFLFAFIAGYIASQDTLIKNTILRQIIAVLCGGIGLIVSFYLFNLIFYSHFNFVYANLRVLSNILTISISLISIILVHILEPYVKQLSK